MVKYIESPTAKLLEGMLDYAALKQKSLAKNISNVTTENYQREDVVFKDVLNEALNPSLKTTNPKHLGFEGDKTEVEYDVVKEKGGDMASGFNNVDIEKEMAEMAENSIRFKFAAKKINDHYTSLKKVIRGTV